MQEARYFLRLAGETFDLELPFVLLVLFIIGTFGLEAYSRRSLRPVDICKASLLALLPLAILLWGTLREHTSERWNATVRNWSTWEVVVLHALAVASAALIVVTVWRSKGRRAFMVAWSVVVMWWLFMAWFASGMSITGDWI